MCFNLDCKVGFTLVHWSLTAVTIDAAAETDNG